MITRISGTLESLEANRAVVTPSGSDISYEVLLPTYLAQRWLEGGMVGERVTLRTIQYLESHGQGSSFIPRLLGFASEREREFFELFTTVKGLGNRRALRALADEPGRIASAISSRDARWLQQLPEIGKRLAETIVAELTGKVEPFALEGAGGVGVGGTSRNGEPRRGGRGMQGPASEAVEALVALGESRTDAERMVIRALEADPPPRTTEQILQASFAAR